MLKAHITWLLSDDKDKFIELMNSKVNKKVSIIDQFWFNLIITYIINFEPYLFLYTFLNFYNFYAYFSKI